MTSKDKNESLSGMELAQLPRWVAGAGDAAFSSGAALAHLDVGLRQMPVPLLRARLALLAAEACVSAAGRSERASDLRDTRHLLRPGDHPGPAGAVYQSWIRATERPITTAALARAMPDLSSSQVAAWSKFGSDGPIVQAASALQTVLIELPYAEAEALIISDCALSRAMGWRFVIPLMGITLRPGDLRKTGDDLQLACHRAAVRAVKLALQLAAELIRRVRHLHSVAPKLRAKSAGDAIALFLSRDAATPSELTHLMSDRAARRLCDRLVALGGVRELTGRDTFRIYGV